MARMKVSVNPNLSLAYSSHDGNVNLADQLQYLDRDDFKRYIDALGEQTDHLAHDVEHVKLFHQQHLGPDKTDKKRDAECVLRSILP
jgi:U3 small nucleolar RNA-associated protein 10